MGLCRIQILPILADLSIFVYFRSFLGYFDPKNDCNFEFPPFPCAYAKNEGGSGQLFFHRINIFVGLSWKKFKPGPVGPH